jgi:hypothetical protein
VIAAQVEAAGWGNIVGDSLERFMRAGLVAAVCGLVGLVGCSDGSFGANQADVSQKAGVAGAKLTGAVHVGRTRFRGHMFICLRRHLGRLVRGWALMAGAGFRLLRVMRRCHC